MSSTTTDSRRRYCIIVGVACILGVNSLFASLEVAFNTTPYYHCPLERHFILIGSDKEGIFYIFVEFLLFLRDGISPISEIGGMTFIIVKDIIYKQ